MTATEYNKCVDQYANALFRFVVKNIKDSDSARDVVQDTFEKMWLKVEQIEFAKSKSYLFTTGYHTMIDKIRKEQRSGLLEERHEELVQTENNYSDLGKILDKALNTLSEIQKSVIMLRDYEGYSYDEIGEITGLNESQVKVYIYRARIALKNYLGTVENLV
ncbi:MAG: RNA polymerase sigma factor [Bacteroidia bacterium]|nr:RNA polymerase sigma factor [Bacteroidia bacterium]MCF8427790.1 RNA polymerase sigma factor [Bacteroidia bacterium]MCF8446028.1 RNA polymerase sigma factor [Bacteroidia bacterium]